MKRKKLMRSKNNRILAGVIGGFAEYFDIDATILRIIFVCLSWSGTSVFLYILLAIIMPSEKRTRNRNYYDSYNRPRKEARKVEEDDSDWSDF